MPLRSDQYLSKMYLDYFGYRKCKYKFKNTSTNQSIILMQPMQELLRLDKCISIFWAAVFFLHTYKFVHVGALHFLSAVLWTWLATVQWLQVNWDKVIGRVLSRQPNFLNCQTKPTIPTREDIHSRLRPTIQANGALERAELWTHISQRSIWIINAFNQRHSTYLHSRERKWT